MEDNRFVLTKGTKRLIFGFIIYLVIMLIIFLPGYLKREKEKLYILTDNYKIKYEHGKWNNITNNDDYRVKEFEVYEDSSYLGKFTVVPGSKYNLYDNGKLKQYNGHLFMYRGTLGLEFPEYVVSSEITENDINVIEEAFIKLGLSKPSTFNFSQKITLDVDNDGVDENIYCVNNFYVEGKDKVSLIFVEDGEKLSIIDKAITDADGIYDEPIYTLVKVIDVRSDNKYELLYDLEYANGSKDNECVKLYDLNKNKEIHNFCK